MAVLIKHNSRLVKKGNMLITGKGQSIVLPANTLRFRFSQSTTNPTSIENGGTWTKVTNSEYNDWDWTSTVWMAKFFNMLTSSVDTEIKIIAAGDTSSITDTSYMFVNCTSLTNVPLFDVSNVTDMRNMFQGCTNVESGALALYQAAEAAGNVISHSSTFTNCGKDTATGLAELQQIPQSWGGLAAG